MLCSASVAAVLFAHGALGFLKVADKPPTGWAWKDTSGHHEPEVAKAHPAGGKFKDFKVGAMSPPAAKAAAFGASHAADGTKVVVSGDAVKKMTRSTNKLATDASSSGDLMGSLARDCKETHNLKEFLPKCMAHVHNLIAEIDYNYGDAQLETTLRNHCTHAEEFPLSSADNKSPDHFWTAGNKKESGKWETVDSSNPQWLHHEEPAGNGENGFTAGNSNGFTAHQSCVEFAEELKNARYLELSSQKTSGYKNFCTKFYEHHGGREVASKKKEEPPRRSAASTPRMVLVALVAGIMGTFGY